MKDNNDKKDELIKRLEKDALKITDEQAARAWKLLFNDFVHDYLMLKQRGEIADKDYYTYINKPKRTKQITETEKQLKQRRDEANKALNNIIFWLNVMVSDAHTARTET